MPQVDIRPAGLDALARTGDPVTYTLTFSPSGYLDGKSFSVTIGGEPVDVTVVSDVMTFGITGAESLALGNGRHAVVLKDTTGDDVTRISGRLLLGSSSTDSPDTTVTILVDTNVSVDVSIVTAGVDLATVQGLIDDLIAGAPGALDTLNELAAALGDDANFAATVTAALATKAAQADLTAEAALARNADNLTSGTVADARIASTIARDSEVTAAIAAQHTADIGTFASLANLPVNVKDHGAVGDGVTDDTAAIQAVLDGLTNYSSKVVVFPPGRYRIASTLTSTTQGLVLRGLGGVSHNEADADAAGATLIADPGVDLMRLGSSTLRHQGPIVENLNFREKLGGKTSNLLEIDSFNRWTIRNCSFLGGERGIYIHHTSTDASWGLIEQAIIRSCTYGLYNAPAGDCTIIGGDWTATTAIYVEPSSSLTGEIRILGAKFDTGIGVHTKGAGAKVMGCRFEACDPAIKIESDTGLHATSGDGTQIIGVEITGHAGTEVGISIGAGCDDTFISGLRTSNVGTAISDLGNYTTIQQARQPFTIKRATNDFFIQMVNATSGSTVARWGTDGGLTAVLDQLTTMRMRLAGTTASYRFDVQNSSSQNLLSIFGNGDIYIGRSGAGVLGLQGASLGFYGTTPVAKPTSVTARAALQNLGLGATLVADDADTLDGANLSTDGTFAGNSDLLVPTQKAVKTYADQLIASADAMVFKGVIDASANPNYPAASKGDTYRISVAGKIGGASGPNVEVGDLILALADGLSAGDHATVGTSWSIAQTNIDGGVVGPTSATDGAVALYDGTTGKLLKNSTAATVKSYLSLVKGDVGLGNVDNTSDADKPVSTAQQAALDLKANAANPVFTGTVTIPDDSLAIADTNGLQAALDAKATAANPVFTGTVTIPDGALAIADTSGLQTALDAKANLASEFGIMLVSDRAYSNVNFASFAATTLVPLGYRRGSTGAQNDEAVFLLPSILRAGTWALTLLHEAKNDRGIYTIAVSPDASAWTDITTIDGYNASNVATRSEATGLTIAAGMQYVRLKMATKNASSSSYWASVSHLSGIRTGA